MNQKRFLIAPAPAPACREDSKPAARHLRKGAKMLKARLAALAGMLALLVAAGCGCNPTNGALQVNLSPAAAVDAGAQWRVDGGAWQDSGATVADLAAGTHAVAFKEVQGWTAPGPQDTLIEAGGTRVADAAYVPAEPAWHAAEPPAGLADAVPMDIDMPASGGGWIVGLELTSAGAEGSKEAVFEGELVLFEGEMVIPAPPSVTGLVLRRTASGWSRASLPELGTNWGLYAASGQSASNGWVAGGDFTQPPVEVTLEGEGEGKAAVDKAEGEALPDPYGAVALRYPGTGLLEGSTNADLRILTAVAAVGPQDVWVATPDGIHRLTNGAWSAETLPADIETVQALAFLGAEDGWAAGSKGNTGAVLRRSGGAWTAAALPALTEPWEVLGVAALAGGEAWAVGQSTDTAALTRTGVLLHCTSGTWQSVAPPAVSANWYLEAVSFPSAAEGWAVGTDLIAHAGVLLHYKDGTWSVSALPAPGGGNWNLVGVSFASSTDGWAVGYDNANGKMLMFQYGP
jgi:hypothetical protein